MEVAYDDHQFFQAFRDWESWCMIHSDWKLSNCRLWKYQENLFLITASHVFNFAKDQFLLKAYAQISYRGHSQEFQNLQTMQDMLSESPWCNHMVADLHFPWFFGTAIQCEIARCFPRSAVKVGLNVQRKNISISSGVQPWTSTDLKLSYFNTQYVSRSDLEKRNWQNSM